MWQILHQQGKPRRSKRKQGLQEKATSPYLKNMTNKEREKKKTYFLKALTVGRKSWK